MPQEMTTRLAGPWVPHVGLDYACVMLPGDTTDIASIEVHTDDPGERDAILGRIAAAPAMLAALKQVYHDWDGEPEDMLDVQAAIALAECYDPDLPSGLEV